MSRPRRPAPPKRIKHAKLPPLERGQAVCLPYRRVVPREEPLACRACGGECRPWKRCCDAPRIVVRLAGAFDAEARLVSWDGPEVEVELEAVVVAVDPVRRTVEIRVGVEGLEEDGDGDGDGDGETPWVQLNVRQATIRVP